MSQLESPSPAAASLPSQYKSAIAPVLAGAALGTLGAYGLARLLKIRPLAIEPAPRPTRDYQDAIARVSLLQAYDSLRVNPVCRTQLLTHGHKTERAIVLLHGLTNCPAQLAQFGQLLFERGMNVLMPRMLHHGLARDSYDFDSLTAEDIVALAAEASDIVHGLGEEKIVLGFSTGGSGAAWAAQHRGDLDRAILVAPALALHGVPLPLQRIFANGLHWLPSKSIWWDPVLKLETLGPPHAYPRAGSHVISELLRLGLIVHDRARREVFAARSVAVVTNPCDGTVDNRRALQIVAQWRRQGMQVNEFAFPREWGLIHDIFDPTKVEEQVARTYPKLIEWLGL